MEGDDQSKNIRLFITEDKARSWSMRDNKWEGQNWFDKVTIKSSDILLHFAA